MGRKIILLAVVCIAGFQGANCLEELNLNMLNNTVYLSEPMKAVVTNISEVTGDSGLKIELMNKLKGNFT
ncbi:unnamed protein product, partial [Allacma fusca]